MSSLIAGLLVRLGDGVFEFGRLVYPNIAPELRRYLYLRYLVETNASLDSLTVRTQSFYAFFYSVLITAFSGSGAGRVSVN